MSSDAQHRFGFTPASGELRIGRESVVRKPNVIGQHAQNVRGLFGPACHTDVDLANRAEPIALEKLFESGLQASG